jgi:hypothetical protein
MTLEERQRAASLDPNRSSYASPVTNLDERRRKQQAETIRQMNATRPPQPDECRCPACLGLSPQGWARVHHVGNDKGEHPMKPPFG